MLEMTREGKIIHADPIPDDVRQALWCAIVREVIKSERIELPAVKAAAGA